jgi:hypothetical protein
MGDILKAETRYLGRHRRRLEDNIKMDLTETVWENVDLIHSTEEEFKCYAVVNTVMNLTRPCNVRI